MNMDKDASALELRARSLLEESIGHTGAHVRSRLNQARQAAVAAAATPARPAWLVFRRGWGLLPAAGAACAAALVLVFMLSSAPPVNKPVDTASTLDVLDLVTDDDNLGLIENGDSSFYEWAAAQGDSAASPGGGGA